MNNENYTLQLSLEELIDIIKVSDNFIALNLLSKFINNTNNNNNKSYKGIGYTLENTKPLYCTICKRYILSGEELISSFNSDSDGLLLGHITCYNAKVNRKSEKTIGTILNNRNEDLKELFLKLYKGELVQLTVTDIKCDGCGQYIRFKEWVIKNSYSKYVHIQCTGVYRELEKVYDSANTNNTKK